MTNKHSKKRIPLTFPDDHDGRQAGPHMDGGSIGGVINCCDKHPMPIPVQKTKNHFQ